MSLAAGMDDPREQEARLLALAGYFAAQLSLCSEKH